MGKTLTILFCLWKTRDVYEVELQKDIWSPNFKYPPYSPNEGNWKVNTHLRKIEYLPFMPYKDFKFYVSQEESHVVDIGYSLDRRIILVRLNNCYETAKGTMDNYYDIVEKYTERNWAIIRQGDYIWQEEQ